jgi:glutaminyl-tRNA synthetase
MLETGFREIQRSAPWPAVVSGIKAEQKDGVTASDATKGPPPESVRFQGMRVAYFCVDSDSAGDRLVLNRIVSLKEDARKA